MCRIRIYSTQTRRKFKTAKTVMHQLSVCDPEVFRIVLIVNSWGALLEGGGGGGGGARNGKYKNGYCSWSTNILPQKDCKGPHTNMPNNVGTIKT